MDIVVPSNFERLLYHLAHQDASLVKRWMAEAAADTGTLSGLSPGSQRMGLVAATFSSQRASDDDIRAVTQAYVASHSLLLCPHTAAGVHAARTLQRDGEPVVCLATAHPGKFDGGAAECGAGAGAATAAASRTLVPAFPPQLARLEGLPTRCVDVDNSAGAVRAVLDAEHAGSAGAPVDAADAAESHGLGHARDSAARATPGASSAAVTPSCGSGVSCWVSVAIGVAVGGCAAVAAAKLRRGWT